MNVSEQKQRSPSRPQKRPIRTCVGCRTTAEKSTLVRIAWGTASDSRIDSRPSDLGERFEAGANRGEVLVIDARGRLPGRGAYIHWSDQCFSRAERGGFARSFRRRISARAVQSLRAMRSKMEGDRIERFDAERVEAKRSLSLEGQS